jgi:hypothetical protein
LGIYGPIEHRYCEPVAEALSSDSNFARFFFERAKRPDWASGARCLKDEQAALRTSGRYWWKNVFCSERRCTCPNLRGREIDILAVFERTDGRRLGMHIECKHPGDKFSAGPAARYRERLTCWTMPEKGPRTIPRHHEAVAILICDRNHNHPHPDTSQFDAVIFFDEIASRIQVYPADIISN